MPRVEDALPLAKCTHHGLVREDVDKPRDPAAALGQQPDRAVRKQGRAIVAGLAQAMHDVVANSVGMQGLELMTEGDALVELTQGRPLQLAVKLGLAEEYDLQELAFLGLKIGQQAECLKTFLGKILGLIDGQNDPSSMAVVFDQALGQALEQTVIVLFQVLQAKLLGNGPSQGTGIHLWIGQPGRNGILIHGIEEFSTEEGFSCAHLAGHFDKALVGQKGDRQDIDRLLMARIGIVKRCIWREAERIFGQAKMAQIHGYSSGRG